MADIVGSAVAGEAVQRLSSLLSGEEGRDQETTEVKVERVELAVLKLETVVAMSEDWQITHAPLLRWRAKLKRVLKEGKDIVRSHRSLARRMRSTSLPRRMARATRRFVPFSRGSTRDGDELSDSTVRRFERVADGADDFFDFVRRGGGHLRIMVFLPAFAWSLAAVDVLRARPGVGEKLQDDGGVPHVRARGRHEGRHGLRGDLLPPQFGAARAAMRELVAGMSSHGRSSPATSAMYGDDVRRRVRRTCMSSPFVRAVQDSHRYGFEPATMCGGEFAGGGDSRSRLPEEILMVCAHCYFQNPLSRGGGLPLELVWHWSMLYTQHAQEALRAARACRAAAENGGRVRGSRSNRGRKAMVVPAQLHAAVGGTGVFSAQICFAVVQGEGSE